MSCNGNCNQGRQCDCRDYVVDDDWTTYLAYIIVVGILLSCAILFGVGIYNIMLLLIS